MFTISMPYPAKSLWARVRFSSTCRYFNRFFCFSGYIASVWLGAASVPHNNFPFCTRTFYCRRSDVRVPPCSCLYPPHSIHGRTRNNGVNHILTAHATKIWPTQRKKYAAGERERAREIEKKTKTNRTGRNGMEWRGKPSERLAVALLLRAIVFLLLFTGEAYEIHKMTCVCVWKIGRVQVFIPCCHEPRGIGATRMGAKRNADEKRSEET